MQHRKQLWILTVSLVFFGLAAAGITKGASVKEKDAPKTKKHVRHKPQPLYTPEALCNKGIVALKAVAESLKDKKVKTEMKKTLEGKALKETKEKCLNETKTAIAKDKDYVMKAMVACEDKKGEEFLNCVGENQPKDAGGP